MLDIKQIHVPKTLSQALALLAENPNVKILAGGTDLVVHMRHQVLDDTSLMSLHAIDALKGIKEDHDMITVGAMTTFTEVVEHPTIVKNIPALVTAISSIAGPQIRNVATIGGNIANGAVSADSVPVLLVYDAQLVIASLAGNRRVALKDFFAGPSRVHLADGELLSQIIIKKTHIDSRRAHFIKYATRKAMDIAVLSVACALSEDADGRIDTLKVAMGVAAPTPLDITRITSHTQGRTLDEQLIQEIITIALEDTSIRNSWRASKDYREHLTGTLICDCLAAITQGGN